MITDEYITSLQPKIDDIVRQNGPHFKYFQAIFDRQELLHNRYAQIEANNGFYVPTRVIEPSLNDPRFTLWIRSRFWYVTEELAESLPEAESGDGQKFFEEVIDALHYLVEVSMFVDVGINTVEQIWETCGMVQTELIYEPVAERVYSHIIMQLGLTANLLKNKEWKQTPVSVNQDEFRFRLLATWNKFFMALKCFGLSKEAVYVLYCLKNEINQKRQEDGY